MCTCALARDYICIDHGHIARVLPSDRMHAHRLARVEAQSALEHVLHLSMSCIRGCQKPDWKKLKGHLVSKFFETVKGYVKTTTKQGFTYQSADNVWYHICAIST